MHIVLLYKRLAHPDDHVREMLENGLTAAGHEVYTDRHLRIGVEWAGELDRKLRDADLVIPLLSRASIASELLEAELTIACEAQLESGKPGILPVRIALDDPLPESLQLVLGLRECARWRSPADDRAVLGYLLGSLAAERS